MGRAVLLGMVMVLVSVLPADATWSIVATDPATGRVGVAIASCVPASVLGEVSEPLFPVVLIPGTAAGVSQAQLNVDAPERIRELVDAGETPSDIVADLASADFDEQAELRQHALVNIDGEVAAFTGSENNSEALDRQGPSVSVQGNLLVSPAVVDDALSSFLDSMQTDADLARALVAGLVAGSEAGGDRRCPESTALFAHLAVAEPGDAPEAPTVLFTVVVAEGSDQNPVVVLTERLATGERGVVDLGGGPAGTGGLVRIVVLIAAAIGLGAGFIVFKRGLGSTKARR